MELRLRLHRPDPRRRPAPTGWSGAAFDDVSQRRERGADEFYAAIAPPDLDAERMRVLRQGCARAGLEQADLPVPRGRWLDGDPAEPPPPPSHRTGRNAGWRHLDAFDVLAMPDPWEYPWFAAWDLAFHAIPWAHLDPAFAKYQLIVLLREWFLHPNGALPAYEWNFDDVNPPVHALAAIRVFVIDGGTDRRLSSSGSSRSCCSTSPGGSTGRTPTATTCSAAASSDWTTSARSTGRTCRRACGSSRPTAPRGWRTTPLAMLGARDALAARNDVYDDMVVKFLEQFVLVMDALESSGSYDVDDGFFYDRLIDATGNTDAIKVQTLVGVIPALPAAIGPGRGIGADPAPAQAVRPPRSSRSTAEVAAGVAVPRRGRRPSTARVDRAARTS